MQDRVLAARFGYKAVELLRDNAESCAIGIKDNKVIDNKKMQNIACDLMIKLVTCKHLLTIKLSHYEKVTLFCVGCDNVRGL